MKLLSVFLALLATRLLPAVRGATVLPKEAAADTPWDDLKSVLSSPDILTPTSSAAWQEECVQIFEDVGSEEGVDGSFAAVSNYQIMDQPAGMCLNHVSCAYEQCQWPAGSSAWPYLPQETSPYVIFEGTASAFTPAADDKLLLPAMVLRPQAASDIVRAVEFCLANNVGITVKVAGHSYFGASTAKNTLLIKMDPHYPKYAIAGGSLTECNDNDGNTTSATTAPLSQATQMACAVALSRDKNAVLRVGGGELFDEAYRAVSIEWNSANPDRKYHLIGGGAGTVSAAGGWMASGGLSGTTGMRMFGIGIDQVVALEMIMPNGEHVQMAPTEWTEKDGEGYPTTTTVTGYCNTNAYEMDEDLWEWIECDDEIDFNELWFAVRGGGGGTYGIVTSLHYQLHDHPGNMVLVSSSEDGFPEEAVGEMTEESSYLFTTIYIEFLLNYLWNPSALNVSDADSRGCNSAQSMNFNPFLGGLMFCYGSSAATFVATWQSVIQSAEVVQLMQNAGIPDILIEALPNLFNADMVYDSYAEWGLGLAPFLPGVVPEGRLPDSPQAAVYPLLGAGSVADSFHTHFPIAAVQADASGLAQLLALDVLTTGGGVFYALGGFVPLADDGLNSLAPTRRTAAFLRAVPNKEYRDTYYGFFFGSLDQAGDFPGSSCHNHALIYEMGPVKSNWSQSCPIDWPQSEREELCFSQNEAAWGTANLRRLETLKASLDPNSLFICTSGVGYSNPVAMDGETSGNGDVEASDNGDGEASDNGDSDGGNGDGDGGDPPQGDDVENPGSACVSMQYAYAYILSAIVSCILWKGLIY